MTSRRNSRTNSTLKSFWKPFKHLVDDKEKSVQRKDVTQEAMDENCPKCGKPLSIRLGRRGRFIGCTAFPDCDYTRSLNEEEDNAAAEMVEGRKCPDCGSDLVIRHGRYGKFIGCSGYPSCKHIEPLEKPADTGVECGKVFYSCSSYPDCQYAVWNEPVDKPCPQCNWPMMTLKITKRHGTELMCPQKECRHTEPYEQEKETV